MFALEPPEGRFISKVAMYLPLPVIFSLSITCDETVASNRKSHMGIARSNRFVWLISWKNQ